jgi:hypothetical protein
MLPRIESGMRDPLPGRHVLGQGAKLGEQLDPGGIRDPLDRREVAEGLGEISALLDHEEGLFPEPVDSAFEQLDQFADVFLHEVAEFFTLLIRVEPVLLLGHGLAHCFDPPRERARSSRIEGAGGFQGTNGIRMLNSRIVSASRASVFDR